MSKVSRLVEYEYADKISILFLFVRMICWLEIVLLFI
jgi:hypothetical protein